MPDDAIDLRALTADIVSAHVASNQVAVTDLRALITNVYTALSGLGSTPEPETPKQKPDVPIRSSVKPDYIVCLEDGTKLQTLKRHLMNSHGLTTQAYRMRWGLPSNYPMVAPKYAETRRSIALQIGLGAKRGTAPVPASATALSDIRPTNTTTTPKPKSKRTAREVPNEAQVSPATSKPARRQKVGIAADTTEEIDPAEITKKTEN